MASLQVKMAIQEAISSVSSSPLAQLETVAHEFLRHNVELPRRYGTAFHITPPWPDAAYISVEPIPFVKSDLSQWSQLTAEDQQRIINLPVTQAYLAWHLTHPEVVTTQLIHVAAGEQRRHVIRGGGSQLYLVVVDEGGQLTLEDLMKEETVSFRHFFIWQKASSRLDFWGLRANVSFLYEQCQVNLIEPGAEATVHHVTYGQGQTQLDMAVRVRHEAPQTTSNLHFRGAADGGQHVYRGAITVGTKAAGAFGWQKAQALLLGPRSVVDMLPQLEILNNDVQCSHGVTTSHLDEAALFYLQSRGLALTQARALAVLGFYNHQLTLPPQIGNTIRRLISSHGSLS